MKKLLFLLDTDPIPNTFDTVVAYDGGVDHVTDHGGVTPENVAKMVDGAIFTRAPMSKKYTALFVSGSTMHEGEAVLQAIKRHCFGNFRVSVMLDSNGGNTTAAAGVVVVMRHMDLAGKRAVVLAGTGPVGQRAAVMLATEGAEVTLTSRHIERAAAACDDMEQTFGVEIQPAVAADPETTAAAIEGAHLIMATGAPGAKLLTEELWKDAPELELLVDANATPPVGIEGIKTSDHGAERHGKICYGAIGFGGLKLDIHRGCIAKLFESNDQVLDAKEIFAFGKEIEKTW
jgi:hypothetical protein